MILIPDPEFVADDPGLPRCWPGHLAGRPQGRTPALIFEALMTLPSVAMRAMTT